MIKKFKKGFTLIELVVVIAVIAILSAISVISYVSITNRAKESNDHMVIDQINTSFLSSQILEKKPTVHEIVERFVEEEGYDVRTIKPELKNAKFVYSYENGKFGYWKDSKVVYPADLAKIDFTGSNDLWFFDDEAKTTYDDSYSHYLKAAGGVTEITTNGGLDVGGCTTISSINLTRPTKAAKDVVIRTNGGTLTVNAPADTVRHYGEGQVITLTAVGTSSYYENGSVEQVNIKKGRLVLTNNENASVETVYLQATGDSYDDIILATQNGAELPDLIARDDVPLPSGGSYKTVVTIQTNVNSEGKQPEKTETINLYSTKGTTGNDVYEATNGYDVSSLATLVVEASSTAAKEQAAEQLPAEVAEKVSEPKVAVGVHNETELSSALGAKAKYIVVKESFTVSNFISITSNVIIEGGNFIITTSATRALRVQSNNIELTIRNLTLDSNNKCERGIQVDSNYKGYKITLDTVNLINNKTYAINMCLNTKGVLKGTNCNISGWSALNLYGESSEFEFTNSHLTGTNPYSSPSNDFAVICFEADTTYATSDYSAFNTVTLNGCTITAIEKGTNRENIVNFNAGTPGTIGGKLVTNNCTFEAANKHACSDRGNGSSWLDNGVEQLASIENIDFGGLDTNEDQTELTGTFSITVNGKTTTFDMGNVEVADISGGHSYTVYYGNGNVNHSLVLYAGGYISYNPYTQSNFK